MTTRSQQWFLQATKAGMDTATSYMGTEVIDSWEQYWESPISDENLRKMTEFGLRMPEAALHRWSLLAGPAPWVLSDEVTKTKLSEDPRWSVLQDVQRQRGGARVE